MGWSIGWDENWKRDIGYGVPAYCDHPDCNETIDRGLAHVRCDQQPYGGDGDDQAQGCGLYFCGKHWMYSEKREANLCPRCYRGNPPYKPKPDHPDWIGWKLTHESWQQWRDENPEEVAALKLLPHNLNVVADEAGGSHANVD